MVTNEVKLSDVAYWNVNGLISFIPLKKKKRGRVLEGAKDASAINVGMYIFSAAISYDVGSSEQSPAYDHTCPVDALIK